MTRGISKCTLAGPIPHLQYISIQVTKNKSEAETLVFAHHSSPFFLTNRTLILNGMPLGPNKIVVSPAPPVGTQLQWGGHVT